MDYAAIFKGASWWKSDSLFTWISDSFQESSNIEIREDSQSITLTKKLVKDSSNTITEPINCYIKASTWDIFAYWNVWGVYHKTWWIWYKNSTTISWAILSAIEFNWYMYLTNSTTLFRVALVNFWHAMTFITYQTFTSSSIYHPFIILENTLYIWDKYYVAYLDNLWDWLPTFLEINNETTITHLKIQWNNIKIYAKDIYDNTNLIYWDTINTAPIQTVPLNWLEMQQLIEKDWYDYIISHNILWIRDWQKLQTLKDNIESSSNINSITIKDDRILYWWTWVIWEWGRLNKNYPDVLSNSYTTSNAITDVVNAIFYTWSELYVSWSNWITHWVDKLSSTVYNTTWYIITRVHYWLTKSIRKFSENVLSAFDKILWTDEIKLYYRTQITWSYILHETLTASSDKVNDYSNMLQLASEFNFIEFKIELSWWTTTPKFYELYLVMDNLQ